MTQAVEHHKAELSFRGLIINRLNELQITAEDLSARANISQKCLELFLNGLTYPRLKEAEAISSALSINLKKFIDNFNLNEQERVLLLDPDPYIYKTEELTRRIGIEFEAGMYEVSFGIVGYGVFTTAITPSSFRKYIHMCDEEGMDILTYLYSEDAYIFINSKRGVMLQEDKIDSDVKSAGVLDLCYPAIHVLYKEESTFESHLLTGDTPVQRYCQEGKIFEFIMKLTRNPQGKSHKLKVQDSELKLKLDDFNVIVIPYVATNPTLLLRESENLH